MQNYRRKLFTFTLLQGHLHNCVCSHLRDNSIWPQQLPTQSSRLNVIYDKKMKNAANGYKNGYFVR